jgi:hypothetical protein
MGKQPRPFNAGFKAQVALDAIKDQRTVQEIASAFLSNPTRLPSGSAKPWKIWQSCLPMDGAEQTCLMRN